ncbi:FHA domain-containing protein [bacterium]|nr:FHA domain-containing protein [bacterium]
MARLQIVSGKREGEFLDLGSGTFQIGTRRAAEIQLRDKDIAYKHANIIVDGAGVFVEDLGSTKGVFVNGGRLAENAKAQVRPQDKLIFGTTELVVVEDGAAAGTASPAPTSVPEAEKPGKKEKAEVEELRFSSSAVAAVAASRTASSEERGAVETVAEPPSRARGDAALEAELRDLRRKLQEKERENTALTKALEGSTDEGVDSGAVAGYMPADVESDLETRVVALQNQADDLQAKLLEKEQLEKDRETAHQDEVAKLKGETQAERKKRNAVEKEVQRLLEAKEGATGDEKKRLEELRTYEEANAQLVLEHDELTERAEALKYQVHQEAGRRGELVRERVRELQRENRRLEESNAELRTLVEAYEEKIDELDERLEEIEGEQEALEKQLDESKQELSKLKNERETMQKTLRQKTQRLEQRVEELEGEKARLKAAGERGGAEGRALPENVKELQAKLQRYESLLDDVEAVEAARSFEARVRELESELAGAKSRLEKAPVGDDAATAVAEARAKVEELEKRARLDKRKIERLERKNRELVRANIAAEMAKADAAQKPGVEAKRA